MSNKGWVGFDLDGTLAVYDGFKGAAIIGEPIPEMVEQLRRFLKRGIEVRIFTARVFYGIPANYNSWDEFWRRKKEATQAELAIIEWCKTHIGVELKVTCVKDFSMWALFDDRAIQVRRNTGEMLGAPSEVLGTDTDP